MSKMLKLFILLGLLILILIGFIKFGSLLAFIWVFPWIIEKLTGIGLHSNIAQALAIPISVALLYGIGYILSRKAENRKKGYIIIGTIFFLWSMVLFLVEKDYNFNPATGEAMVYVAETPYGLQEVPIGSRVHPVYGTEVKPITPELARQKTILTKGLPGAEKLQPTTNDAFFDQAGNPLVWYYQYPDGKIELFTRPGFHPQLGVAINPINSEIAKKVMESLDKIKLEQIAREVELANQTKQLQQQNTKNNPPPTDYRLQSKQGTWSNKKNTRQSD